MAILKHFSMKSGNYTGAIEYLLYEHDEYTQKLVKDEYDIPVIRDGVLFDGINCDPWGYDYECSDLNREYNKNQNYNDVKQHHYIISFDPKDVTESGLTAEHAHELGLEYAKRNFPGHQTLVCTHPDGHNHSGNLHVHIVFNSLRKCDVDSRDFMERDCDHKAGFKHHETKHRMVLLKIDLMNMCKRENLHQVDLLSPAKERITDKEYYAAKRLEENEHSSEPVATYNFTVSLNHDDPKATNTKSADNKEDKKTGTSSKDNSQKEQKSAEYAKASDKKNTAPSKFETQKSYLRRAITDSASHAKSDSEFASILLEKYKVTLKISRGKFSYLHPDRTKPIRGRMLGTDYEETSLRKIFEQNRSGIDKDTPTNLEAENPSKHQEMVSSPTTGSTSSTPEYNHGTDIVPNTGNEDPEPESAPTHWRDQFCFIHHIGTVVPATYTMPTDLQLVKSLQYSALCNIESANDYQTEQMRLDDLKRTSRAIAYAQEHGFDTLDDIDKTFMDRSQDARMISRELTTIEKKLDTLNEDIYFSGMYYSTKSVYTKYCQQPTQRKRAAFLEAHKKAILDHKQAIQYFRSQHPGKPIPQPGNLKQERKEIILPQKSNLQSRYQTARKSLDEIAAMRKNIHSLLNQQPQLSREKEKLPHHDHTRSGEAR